MKHHKEMGLDGVAWGQMTANLQSCAKCFGLFSEGNGAQTVPPARFFPGTKVSNAGLKSVSSDSMAHPHQVAGPSSRCSPGLPISQVAQRKQSVSHLPKSKPERQSYYF